MEGDERESAAQNQPLPLCAARYPSAAASPYPQPQQHAPSFQPYAQAAVAFQQPGAPAAYPQAQPYGQQSRPQSAPQYAPVQASPRAPPKIMCYQCRRQFQVPAGSSIVACPYCQAHNRVPT